MARDPGKNLGRIRGPGGSNEEGGMERRTEGNLRPEPAYEATSHIPKPEWGGRARFTRTLPSDGTYESGGVQEQETEPRYERGPKRTFKRTT